MDPRDILRTKRDGGRFSREEIDAFLTGYSADRIPDYQAAAIVATIFVRGMEGEELYEWTSGMLASGATLDFPALDGPKVDKHSTGGVGDKVSLPLAPALAACGAYVPMISGRGLGHTGGTLDKLEAIPGLRTALERDEIEACLRDAGAVIAAQTAELVPADRKLYALRDATGLVESIPLIASSIMSKKLAEGLDALLLDVKFGSGAFLPDRGQGRALGDTMAALAERFDLPTRVIQTSMVAPLGRAIGHALEVQESLDCVSGRGPADLRELVVLFGGVLLHLVGLAASDEEGRARIAAVLDDGRARESFLRMIAAQGGDTQRVETGLELAPDVEVFEARTAGRLRTLDCRRLGLACAALGGGRERLGDRIDHAVGFVLLAEEGQDLNPGDPILEIHHRAGHGLDAARAHLAAALTCESDYQPVPLVFG